MPDHLTWAWDIAKNWGGQAFFALLVWAFLAQKIGVIERVLGEIKKTLKIDCEEHEKLHARATKNETDISYLKGKLNGQHETK